MEEKRVNWITFTSSSTAKNFATLLGPDYKEKLKGIHLASIGPITTDTLHELGLKANNASQSLQHRWPGRSDHRLQIK